MTTAIQQVPAVTQQQRTTALTPTRAGFFDLDSFELMQRVSKAFASSDLVPQQYRGNLANCMIALDMAQRIGANPLMCMQNLYIVHGTPGWSSKFLIATINACGRFSSLRYEWRGEPGTPDHGCRAWAIERETGERLEGIWVTWKMVKAEGWDGKNGSKWRTMPDQMFVYRAAAFWQRAYAPELAMGLQTVEDLQDVIEVTPTPAPAPKPARIYMPTPERAPAVASEGNEPPAVDQQTGEIAPPVNPADPAEHLADEISRASLTDVAQLNADIAAAFEAGHITTDSADLLTEMLERRHAELITAASAPAPAASRRQRAATNIE